MKNKPEYGLQHALQQLPDYAPEERVWDAIAQQLEQDEAEAPLREAIRQLPGYAPPDSVWQGIERALPEQPLQNGLSQLPSYDPPPELWSRIEKNIPGRRAWLPWISRAAAAILLALGAWYLWPSASPDWQLSYDYAQKDEAMLWKEVADWDDDEAAMRQAVALFERDPVAKSIEAYEELLQAWDELSEAKAEIAEIMELYGKDAELIRQMSEIERERSGIVRRMIAQI